ncbi:class I adenylate-forming enzyme family protein [Prosthecochloris sp. GSB1]|uniref:class I adenylate-forming enzyme family protein n=1 Tax=Prosthecochloris sp. GSB1 TaxID=281093 RepID=UPI00142DC5E0|nr:class I adenylate-forming enzyme family protein [Prosthecochloris sp. GSB1]
MREKRLNLFDYLLENGLPDNVAIIQDGTSTTYRELRAMAEAVALALGKSGISPGDRVAILAENSPFWAASYLGILKTGAVAAPLPSRLTAGDLARYVRVLACRAFCADNLLAKKHSALMPEKNALVLKNDILGRKNDVAGTVQETVRVYPANDLAALMFTSGSTGEPNAVMVTHRNIMANTASIIAYLGLGPDDRMMAILPFHYCFGTSLLHTHLRAGASLVLNNYFQYVEDVLNEMEEEGCTGFAGVPSTYQTLLSNKSFRGRGFGQLRHVQQAGGKLPDRQIAELRAILPKHVNIHIGYGQTEATARLSALPPDKLEEKTGSIGRGIPGVSLQVLDKEGKPVKPGETGEIVASGENIAPGYLFADPSKNPFRDGRLYTGDLASVDEEGYIFITGREKDFIKPSGYKVMTATIENAILEMPGVAEAAVVGIPDDQLGEAAKACVVVTQSRALSPEQIIDFCTRSLPPYAVPRIVEFLEALPKNASGKILKSRLKKQ